MTGVDNGHRAFSVNAANNFDSVNNDGSVRVCGFVWNKFKHLMHRLVVYKHVNENIQSVLDAEKEIASNKMRASSLETQRMDGFDLTDIVHLLLDSWMLMKKP
nr:hypothetical protein [Tanacetum cinerariifolium]